MYQLLHKQVCFGNVNIDQLQQKYITVMSDYTWYTQCSICRPAMLYRCQVISQGKWKYSMQVNNFPFHYKSIVSRLTIIPSIFHSGYLLQLVPEKCLTFLEDTLLIPFAMVISWVVDGDVCMLHTAVGMPPDSHTHILLWPRPCLWVAWRSRLTNVLSIALLVVHSK